MGRGVTLIANGIASFLRLHNDSCADDNNGSQNERSDRVNCSCATAIGFSRWFPNPHSVPAGGTDGGGSEAKRKIYPSWHDMGRWSAASSSSVRSAEGDWPTGADRRSISDRCSPGWKPKLARIRFFRLRAQRSTQLARAARPPFFMRPGRPTRGSICFKTSCALVPRARSQPSGPGPATEQNRRCGD
jgi:hypothetical protein